MNLLIVDWIIVFELVVEEEKVDESVVEIDVGSIDVVNMVEVEGFSVVVVINFVVDVLLFKKKIN